MAAPVTSACKASSINESHRRVALSIESAVGRLARVRAASVPETKTSVLRGCNSPNTVASPRSIPMQSGQRSAHGCRKWPILSSFRHGDQDAADRQLSLDRAHRSHARTAKRVRRQEQRRQEQHPPGARDHPRRDLAVAAVHREGLPQARQHHADQRGCGVRRAA